MCGRAGRTGRGSGAGGRQRTLEPPARKVRTVGRLVGTDPPRGSRGCAGEADEGVAVAVGGVALRAVRVRRAVAPRPPDEGTDAPAPHKGRNRATQAQGWCQYWSNPRGGDGGAGRRVGGARIEQVLEQDIARVLYSDRPRLKHTEPSLRGSEAGAVS